MDLESLERLAGRKLLDPVKISVRAAQHKAYRYTLTKSRAGKIDARAAAVSEGEA
jgi:hypothetical protein